jgi:hypothetical protein
VRAPSIGTPPAVHPPSGPHQSYTLHRDPTSRTPSIGTPPVVHPPSGPHQPYTLHRDPATLSLRALDCRSPSDRRAFAWSGGGCAAAHHPWSLSPCSHHPWSPIIRGQEVDARRLELLRYVITLLHAPDVHAMRDLTGVRDTAAVQGDGVLQEWLGHLYANGASRASLDLA